MAVIGEGNSCVFSRRFTPRKYVSLATPRMLTLPLMPKIEVVKVLGTNFATSSADSML